MRTSAFLADFSYLDLAQLRGFASWNDWASVASPRVEDRKSAQSVPGEFLMLLRFGQGDHSGYNNLTHLVDDY